MYNLNKDNVFSNVFLIETAKNVWIMHEIH